MRIKDNRAPADIILERTRKHLKAKYEISPTTVSLLGGESDKTTDLVVDGDFLHYFSSSSFWPKNHFRIWALSSALKDVFIKLLNFPPDTIHVIPRASLFPAAGVERQSQFLIKGEDRITFILTDRFANSSLAEFNLNMLEILKNKYLPKSRVSATSDVPDTENPVFLALNTELDRKLNVPLGLGQELGKNQIVAHHGEYLDIAGPGTLRIQPEFLCNQQDSDPIRKLKATVLAEKIFNLLATEQVFTESKPQAVTANFLKPISPTAFESLRLEFITNYSEELSQGFLETEKGSRFFAEYHQIFSPPPPSSVPVVFVPNTLKEDESTRLTSYTHERISEKKTPVFVRVADCSFPRNRQLLLNSEEIIFCGQSSETSQVLKWITGLNPIPMRILGYNE